MQTPLLTTKLFIPPIRPELVLRPNLIKRLNDGLHRKLTVISAPAGFGKSTLLSTWVQNADPQICIGWLSLDEGDNDLTRFLTYFIAALDHADGVEDTFGANALNALLSSQAPPVESILTSLINEAAACSAKTIFILDDYHSVGSSLVDEALTFFVENLPPQIHLIIATREDPHLPLSRLRARGQLSELRAADLRFTSSEAAEFLNQVMGLDLSEEQISALETRTEGWIAGLQLAAISMRGHEDTAGLIKSFTGSHRFVLDYLIEEVLNQQPESVQAFLLQTSVLSRLTAPLCDALSGQDNGQETLEMLEHSNLFIVPLDGERQWYRYHHLFADLLRRRLRQTQPEQRLALHRRASEWYEKNGPIEEAIEHAVFVEDFERAACLIEIAAEAVWGRGEYKLRRWLDGLPVELIYSMPRLSIFHAWFLLSRGKLDEADRVLGTADTVLGSEQNGDIVTLPHECDRPHNLDRQALQGRVAVVRAFSAFYRGDIPMIIQYAHKALEDLPEQDISWRSTAAHVLGDAYDFSGDIAKAYQSRLEALETSSTTTNRLAIMIANVKLILNLRHQGLLPQVQEMCKQQLQLANEYRMVEMDVFGWLLAVCGEALAETNQLDTAISQVEKGVVIIENGGDIAMLGWSYICLIRALFSGGKLSRAQEVIHKMENITRESNLPPWIKNQNAAWQARIWLAQGQLAAASQWVEERGLDASSEPVYLHEMEYMVLARILIAQNKLDEAHLLLQRLLDAIQAGGRTSRMIEILNLQALAFQAGGEPTLAMAALERALTLAEPGGLIRIFVDEGQPMGRLLYEALAKGVSPDYIHRLLAAFPDAEPQQDAPSRAKALNAELIEPLSEREIEVLQLLAKGLTNPEIASRLYLSLNTIKVHTRNIYGKIGANNRTQAVARARALGILPSD